MELFSYKDGCGVHGHCTHIDAFKEDLSWATDEQFRLLII